MHKASNSYEGFVAEAAPEVGVIVIATVCPNSGNRVASTESAPKSWKKSRDKLASFKPPIRVREVLPKLVVSCSDTVISSVAAAIELEKSVPPIVML